MFFTLFFLSISVQVLEIRPVIDWNKGKAVKFLLESLGLSNSDVVLPIYVGDDQTDEDAFKVRDPPAPRRRRRVAADLRRHVNDRS